jgi:hypothetical protein
VTTASVEGEGEALAEFEAKENSIFRQTGELGQGPQTLGMASQ